MSHYQDFSSWQPEQERHFVVFEQRTMESSKRAWTVGAIAGAAMFFVVIMVVLGFKPDKSSSEAAADEGDEGMKAEPAAPAPAPTPAPAATPDPAATPAAPAGGAATGTVPAAGATAGAAPAAGTAPADAPAAGTAAGAATAPPPPKGATKAPPTDLVKANK
jgi:hypothetical protein